jgi:hypothetical protein
MHILPILEYGNAALTLNKGMITALEMVQKKISKIICYNMFLSIGWAAIYWIARTRL